MRFIPALCIALTLTGCDLATLNSAPHARVDAASLPPLTSREQSLIFGADGAVQQGNFAAAEHDNLNAIALSSGHIEAHLALARIYEKQNAPQKEHEVLERALELQPDNALANYLMGKLALDNNQYDEARTAFARGLSSQPDNIDLATGQAVAEDMAGNHAAAQADYLRLLHTHPHANLTSLRTNLAMSYLLSGHAQKAVDVLQADAKKPDAPTVTRHNLALAYGLLGRNAEATQLLHGEIDEETRLLNVARLKEYIKERTNGLSPAVPTTSFGQVSMPPKPAKKPSKFEAALKANN